MKKHTKFVPNCLGKQATQIIKSQGIAPTKPKDVYDALEKNFGPESNDTITKPRFHSKKQKQGQSVDAYLTNLSLLIPECNHHKDTIDDIFKNQSIFGLTAKEIQDTLLNKIESDDTIGKCLLKARKVESQIEQRKILGIKTSMSYDTIGQYGGNKRYQSKSKGKG